MGGGEGASGALWKIALGAAAKKKSPPGVAPP
jgi:hypothetical protein